MSDITLINDSEQSSLVTNGLAKNGEMYLKKEGSTDAGSIVVYDSGVWKTFANEYSAGFVNTYSVDLDGTNDYMVVSASSDFSFGTGDFTISLWFNADVIAAGGINYYALYDWRGGGSDIAPTLYMSQQTGYRLYAYNGSTVVNYNTTPSVGQWYHVAYTRSGTTGTIYLNGSSVASGTDSANYSMSTPSPRIGSPGLGVTGAYVNGKVDEVSVFNSALSASDVAALRDTTGSNPVPADISSLSPIGWWRMGDNDSGTGSTITDQGSGGNDGTLTNGPTFSTTVPS